MRGTRRGEELPPGIAGGMGPWSSSFNQFLPSQGITERPLYFRFADGGEFADPFGEPIAPKGVEVIKISSAMTGKAVTNAELDFHRNAADCGCDLGDDELIQVRVGIIAGKQKNRPTPRGFWKIGPPYFELLHGLNSSQLDQSTASEAESGCFR